MHSVTCLTILCQRQLEDGGEEKLSYKNKIDNGKM